MSAIRRRTASNLTPVVFTSSRAADFTSTPGRASSPSRSPHPRYRPQLGAWKRASPCAARGLARTRNRAGRHCRPVPTLASALTRRRCNRRSRSQRLASGRNVSPTTARRCTCARHGVEQHVSRSTRRLDRPGRTTDYVDLAPRDRDSHVKPQGATRRIGRGAGGGPRRLCVRAQCDHQSGRIFRLEPSAHGRLPWNANTTRRVPAIADGTETEPRWDGLSSRPPVFFVSYRSLSTPGSRNARHAEIRRLSRTGSLRQRSRHGTAAQVKPAAARISQRFLLNVRGRRNKPGRPQAVRAIAYTGTGFAARCIRLVPTP